jgi:hypothetical protein
MTGNRGGIIKTGRIRHAYTVGFGWQRGSSLPVCREEHRAPLLTQKHVIDLVAHCPIDFAGFTV